MNKGVVIGFVLIITGTLIILAGRALDYSLNRSEKSDAPLAEREEDEEEYEPYEPSVCFGCGVGMPIGGGMSVF